MMRLPGGSLIKFFVLTYAVTWTCFVSVAAAGTPARTPLGVFLVLLGAYAPSLAALWLTARADTAATSGGESLVTSLMHSVRAARRASFAGEIRWPPWRSSNPRCVAGDSPGLLRSCAPGESGRRSAPRSAADFAGTGRRRASLAGATRRGPGPQYQ